VSGASENVDCQGGPVDERAFGFETYEAFTMRNRALRKGIWAGGVGALMLTAGSAIAALPDVNTTASEALPEPSRGRFPVLAQGSQCVGGYRVIHRVRGQGRTGEGVILRCRR
jgi:hypothetical protein